MTLPYPIAASQTDAKSPVDQQLMDAIRLDLLDLDSRIATAGAFDYAFKLNGPLRLLCNPRTNYTFTSPRRRFDGCVVSKEAVLQSGKISIEAPGEGTPGVTGKVEADVRKYRSPNIPITGVEALFSASIQSIGRVGSSFSTQSVARSTSQISTQSISRWKSTLNIQSIVLLGHGYVRYNVDAQPDSGWNFGSITVASASDSDNNGTFTVVRTNDDGGNNLIVYNSNAGASDQSGAAGTIELNAWKYVYVNPVSSEFAVGESAVFASHTNSVNNGTFPILAVNSGGNNIVVENASGDDQASAAGNANTLRWIYAASAAVDSTAYVVGEKAEMSGHTSGVNDGKFPITAVNSGGNNIVVYNPNGASQAGAAGTVNTLRWIYAFSVSPASDVAAGEYVYIESASTAANNGTFLAKEINRSASNNIVVYNPDGATQVGAAGTLTSGKMKVKFASDQSSYMNTKSRITIAHVPVANDYGRPSDRLSGDYDVLQVNRGGGANYNAVVLATGMRPQAAPWGRVVFESKSIFSTRPSISFANQSGQWGAVSSNGVLDEDEAAVEEGQLIMADLLDLPVGDVRNLTVHIS